MTSLRAQSHAPHILIVEDDALLAPVLAEQLAAAGYRTTVESNGAAVASLAQRIHPNAIILDLLLPGLDGFTVHRALRSNPATRNIPVLVLSNLSGEADVRSAHALGASRYLIKANTDIRTIIATVRSLLASTA